MKLKTSLRTGGGARLDANLSPVEIWLDAAGFIPHGPVSTAGYSGYLGNTVLVQDSISKEFAMQVVGARAI
jgi:hypothetical protein